MDLTDPLSPELYEPILTKTICEAFEMSAVAAFAMSMIDLVLFLYFTLNRNSYNICLLSLDKTSSLVDQPNDFVF